MGGLAQREQGSLRHADAARSMSPLSAAADACTIDSGALGTLAFVLCAFRNSSACMSTRSKDISLPEDGYTFRMHSFGSCLPATSMHAVRLLAHSAKHSMSLPCSCTWMCIRKPHSIL